MIENLWNLLALLVILLAATVFGLQLLRWWVTDDVPIWERVSLGLGLGLGILSYTVLALGSLQLAYAVTGYVVVGVSLLVGWSEIYWLCRQVWNGLQKVPHHLMKIGWMERLLLLFLLASVIVNLISALAPPTGNDELNYHFAIPKVYLQTHQVGYIPTHRLSVTPFGMEMLWLLAMMLHSATVAQLLNWSLGLFLAFMTGMLAIRAHSLKAGLLAASFIYAVTVIGDLSGGGKPELGGAVFLLLSILALLHWREMLERRWLILAGVFAGFFAGTKLPNPLVVFMLTIGVVVYTWRRRWLYRALSAGVVLGGVAALLFSIWMIRAWLWTGNPVYPFLPTLFGGRDLPNLSIFIPTATGPGSVVTNRSDPLLTPKQFWQYRHPLELLASPWTLSMGCSRLGSGFGTYRGVPGPIFLGLLPAVLLYIRRFPLEVKFMLWLAPFLYIGWFLSYSMLRNVLAVLAVLSVPTAIVFVGLANQTKIISWLMVIVLASWLAISLTRNCIHATRALPVVIGFVSPQVWLRSRLPMDDLNFRAYPAYEFMNKNLPPNSKVLLWESRGFYLDRPYLRVYEFMYGVADLSRLQSRGDVLEELHRWGITHVAMTDEPKRLWLRKNLEATGKLKILFKDSGMTVCKLLSSSMVAKVGSCSM